MTPYTFPEVLARIAHGGWEMFWPGEFGHGDVLGIWVQLSPLLALLLWVPCLVPWRTRARRVAALVLALLIPAWFVAVAWPLDPQTFDISRTLACIFDVGTGEEWQEACVALPAMTLWWLLLLPLIVLTSWRRVGRLSDSRCRVCGYSTIGLTTNVCPECGDRIQT
jgi:peptidoglycan/LPS O-acetylase OafA/YrhL